MARRERSDRRSTLLSHANSVLSRGAAASAAASATPTAAAMSVATLTELVRAAKLDGAGFFNIFRHIFLPLSTPIFVVTIIWQFTQIWNDFLFGVVYSGSGTQPITVALNNLVNTSVGGKEYNVDMAAAIIAALPTLVVYVIAGKYFVRGLTAGAVKG